MEYIIEDKLKIALLITFVTIFVTMLCIVFVFAFAADKKNVDPEIIKKCIQKELETTNNIDYLVLFETEETGVYTINHYVVKIKDDRYIVLVKIDEGQVCEVDVIQKIQEEL